MNEILEKTLLIDFYGKFLTDKQKDMYKMRYEEDMSLSEISDIFNISRQAVSENINSAEKILYNYETELKLIQKQKKMSKLIKLVDDAIKNEDTSIDIIKKIKKELEKLEEIKG